MNKLRLFIAIDIPGQIKKKLVEVQDELRQTSLNVKWVPAENLHLTMKFLGDTEATRSIEIASVIEMLTKETAPFFLEVTGLGTFPSKGRPKVVWAGVDGEMNRLYALQQNLEIQLERLGFLKEARKYSPHLTLGRAKEFGELGSLPECLSKYKTQSFGQWEIASLKLIQSTLRPTGPDYTVLADSPLGAV